MKKFAILSMTAASVLALSAGLAAAQGFGEDRYDAASDRIDAAVRLGDITSADAANLREELGDIGTLTARYDADGISSVEAVELNRRYDNLSTRIDALANSGPARVGWYGGLGWMDRAGVWTPVNARQAELQRRIDRGLANGRLTPAEAARLQAQYRDLAALEARYRWNGLSNSERRDLDRRFDQLAFAIRFESRDAQYGYGYGFDR